MDGMTKAVKISKAETPERIQNAEEIDGRLNAILLETRNNLDDMLQINSILFGAKDLSCEGKSEKEPKIAGWFYNVIDMLKMIGANNINLKKELERLRKEFKE